MIRYRASVVVPVAGPPIRGGSVAVEGDRIVSVDGPGATTAGTVDLGDVALMPGLVNAHTHLELSHLRDRVPPAAAFTTWIRGVLGSRGPGFDPRAPEILAGVDAGIAEALASGTALVGDISNTLVTFEALARSPLAGLVCLEVIRFRAPDPQSVVAEAWARVEGLAPTARIRATLAAHSPYSVAPAVLRGIHARTGDAAVPWSVHLSESAEEVEFVATGGGPWRALLEGIGAWDPDWRVPGTSPVGYLDGLGVLDERAIVVHGVQMGGADLACLRARGATLVACPRSNAHTGAGVPPLAAFYASGVRVAVGTDSLASTADLNLFEELATMRCLAPGVPAAALLDSATRQGARALGFANDYGTLEPGKRARLLAVAVPARTDDVEEYLVSGIRPEQVRWVE